MEQTNNEPKSFVFHPSYYETINTLWGEWPGWDLFQAICNCWMYDDYTTDFDDQTLKVLMQVIIPTMKSAKKRRDANIENWKKWWRPKKDWDNSQKPKETEPNPTETQQNPTKPNHNLNININNNINKNNNITNNKNKNNSELNNKKPNEIEEIKDNSEVDIEKLIDSIIETSKSTIERCWWVYDSKNERKFAKELLTNKDVYQWRQEHYKCTINEFIINTIKASYTSYNYSNKIDSLFKLFYNYQSIYNNTISSPKEDKNIKYTFYINHYNWNRTYVEKRKAIANFVTENIPLPR